MIHQTLDKFKQKEVASLFTSVFTYTEGEKEGSLIGNLSSGLASGIDNEDIICFGSYDNELLIACIFFTRLQFNQVIEVYMLAPVAVRTEYQGKGVGQALIKYGMNELKRRSVNVAITYGDPSFYSKVGFEPLSESVIQAPLELSMPVGWLGQSLTNDSIPALLGRPACVKQFDDPVYW